MAATKKLDPKTLAAFKAAGITLTPAQEHVAASSGINWTALLKELAQAALQNLPALVSFILGLLSTKQTPAKTAAAGCCDHHCCCCKALEAILYAAQIEAEHCCECCCE